MIVIDVKEGFYGFLTGKKTLILASIEVDSVCATKILTTLLQEDNTTYTVQPVLNYSYVIKNIEDKVSFFDHVVLINCGSLVPIDILKYTCQFHIIDSHRPILLDHIYNTKNINVIYPEDENFDVIPDLSDNIDEDKENKSKYERAQKLKKINEYYEFSSYGVPASRIMINLVFSLKRENYYYLWLSILGFTEHYLLSKIDREKYIIESNKYHDHLINISQQQLINIKSINNSNNISISYENELSLLFLQHWSILESIMNTNYTFCKFRVWNNRGRKKLCHFLAEIGIPLYQCNQKFSSISLDIRKNIKEIFSSHLSKYKLEDINFNQFIAQVAFQTKLQASDVTHSLICMLHKDLNLCSNFFDAMECFGDPFHSYKKIIEQINFSIPIIQSINDIVKSLVGVNRLMNAGPFLFGAIPKSSNYDALFSGNLIMHLLANYSLKAYVTENKKAIDLPLVILFPKYDDINKCIIAGIPPINNESNRTFFGSAFKETLRLSNIHSTLNSFESWIIEISINEKTEFLKTLTHVLTV